MTVEVNNISRFLKIQGEPSHFYYMYFSIFIFFFGLYAYFRNIQKPFQLSSPFSCSPAVSHLNKHLITRNLLQSPLKFEFQKHVGAV